MLDVSVTIIIRDGALRIADCVRSIQRAVSGYNCHLLVLANGCRDNTAEVALLTARAVGACASIYVIPYGDKSNAINSALYDLRQRATCEVFVDGYCTVSENSISAFKEALSKRPALNAVSGVSANGRTMKLLTRETVEVGGKLHGQFHAFQPEFLDRLIKRRFRIPIGLYRGDGLLGSMACHNLDPLHNSWDNERIVGISEAQFSIPQLSFFRPSDYVSYVRRRLKQTQGQFETKAIQDLIYSYGYECLPNSAAELLTNWVSTHSLPRTSMFEHFFRRTALLKRNAKYSHTTLFAPCVLYGRVPILGG